MPKQAWIPARPDAEAAQKPTGFVISVPKGNHTDGKHLCSACTEALAVPVALATKLASATHCSPCTLAWRLSGTTAKMLAHPATTQLIQLSRHGGTVTNAAASKSGSVTAPLREARSSKKPDKGYIQTSVTLADFAVFLLHSFCMHVRYLFQYQTDLVLLFLHAAPAAPVRHVISSCCHCKASAAKHAHANATQMTAWHEGQAVHVWSGNAAQLSSCSSTTSGLSLGCVARFRARETGCSGCGSLHYLHTSSKRKGIRLCHSHIDIVHQGPMSET